MHIFGIVGKTVSGLLSGNLCSTAWTMVTHQGVKKNKDYMVSLPDSEQTFFLEEGCI